MIRRTPRATRTDTLFPYTTLFRSGVCCAEACSLDRRGSFHRPAAGEALFRAEKDPKRLAPGRTPVRLLRSIGRCAAYAFATLGRSEEHTSELQSLMRISYAVFCLKKKIKHHQT